MCGLVGAFRANNSLFDHKIKEFMEKGLYISALRGVQGTGVGIVDKDFEIGHVKSHVDSASFLQTNQWEWAKRESSDARAILGHTRHSTIQGSISAKNSHPFHWRVGNDEIILTHNGHVSNAWSLTPNNWNHPVDSAHIAYALLREKDPVKVLEKLTGFWALAWFDSRDHTFRITRNHTRDLYYAYSPDKTKIYYASEAEILHFVCKRENIDLADEEYHEIEPAEMLVWDLSKKTLDEPTKIGYTEKKDTPPWQAYRAPRAAVGTGGMKSGNTTPRTGEYSRLNALAKGRVNPQDTADVGDMIYVAVDDFSTFTKYTPTPEKTNSVFDWGHLRGTRRLDKNSVVQLDSVQRSISDEVLKFIGDGIPCIVDKVVIQTDDAGAKTVTYNARVDKTRVIMELQKAVLAAKRKKEVDPDNGPDLPSMNTIHKARSLLNIQDQNPSSQMVPGPEGPIPLRDWLIMAELCCMMCDGQIIRPDVGKVKFYEWVRGPNDHGQDKDFQMICPTCCDGMDKEKTVVNPHVENRTVQ